MKGPCLFRYLDLYFRLNEITNNIYSCLRVEKMFSKDNEKVPYYRKLL